MRVSKFILAFLLFLVSLTGCARKGPPTSPDRSPPRLLWTRAVDRGYIEVGFSERITAPESLMIEGLNVRAVTAMERKIIISTDDMDTLKYRMKLWGIGDLSENRQELHQTEFRGTLMKDTIPPIAIGIPRVLRGLSEDTSLTIRFADWIEGCFLYIMPPVNKEYKWNKTKTELTLNVSGLERRTIYNLYGRFWDRAKNLREIHLLFTMENETPLLWISGTVGERTLLLLSREEIPQQFLISDSLFLFQNLYPDNYTLFGKTADLYFSSGPFTLSLPIEGLNLSPIALEDIDGKLISIMDSLYYH
ncbi:hypothetical protein LR066_04380 [candidate division WOR-3 bacterium]|nr:hypothetical protein [candidate division WOR-3 bacterium]